MDDCDNTESLRREYAKLTDEQKAAVAIALKARDESEARREGPLFRTCTAIWGMAGSGKSVVIRYIHRHLQHAFAQEGRGLWVAVTASTNAAAALLPDALNINEFVGFVVQWNDKSKSAQIYPPFGYRLHKLKDKFEHLGCIIIDEAGMLDKDFLDALNRFLKAVVPLCRRHLRFGGIQIILCGDLLQLPPVPMYHAKEHPSFPSGFHKYVITSKCWKKAFPLNQCILLRAQLRQSNDPFFQRLLVEIHKNALTHAGLQALQSRIVDDPDTIPDTVTAVCPMLYQMDHENTRLLTKFLPDEPDILLEGSMTITRKRTQQQQEQPAPQDAAFGTQGCFANAEKMRKKIPIPLDLTLRRGCKIVCRANIDDVLYNGAHGVFLRMFNDKAVVHMNGTPADHTRIVDHHLWTLPALAPVEGILHIRQFPFLPAYAMSIHACQGTTLPGGVYIWKGCSQPGQFFTAISRATTLANVYLQPGFEPKHIIAEPYIIRYYADLAAGIVPDGSAAGGGSAGAANDMLPVYTLWQKRARLN